MKRNRWIKGFACGALCLCAAIGSAQAQFYVGGAALNRDIMMHADFAALSRPQLFGTARAMGMGGAFVSLGADLTAMSLNPAGLGMYQHSEVSISPLLAFSHASTPGTDSWGSNNKTRFALADFGAAINLFERVNRGGVSSMTLGFGLHRVADFNTRYSYSSEQRYNGTMVPSIADLFAAQMNYDGIFPAMGNGGNPNGQLNYADPFYWPAVLAYKSAMTHVAGSGGNLYWEPDAIGERASILRSVDAIDRGSINEFNISVGGNYNNVVYIGASFGLQSVYKNSLFVYGEDYGYFHGNDNGYAYGPDGRVLPAQLEYADLWQRTILDGIGFNFKLGVIVRPIAGLRLGAAFHSPTYYTLERSYAAGMDYSLLANDPAYSDESASLGSPTQYDEAGDSWEFISPTRLMFGASYAFGKFAIVSVDYERDWYNGIRVKQVPYGVEFGPADYKGDFKNLYQATNTLRAGIEVRPMPTLALRAGYSCTSSMLRNEQLSYEGPQSTTSNYYTLGAGFNLTRSVSLDIAYQHQTDNRTSYYLFYGDMVNEAGIWSERYSTSLKRDFVTLTLGVHF